MKYSVFSNIILTFSIAVLISCAGANARESTAWTGIYSGTIPAADGQGINVKITLNPDHTYLLEYNHIDKEGVFSEEGNFYRFKTSNFIVLQDSKYPKFYKVREGYLLQLDMEGKIITGDMEELYILKKNKT